MSTRLPSILCLLLAFAGTAVAQTFSRPKTFLNLAWGSPRAEVIKAIADTGATVTDATYEITEPKMDIVGGKFAGQDVTTWSLEFIHGKLVAAAVTLKAADGNSVALYRQIVQELTRKYGPHPVERKFSTLTADQRKVYVTSGQRPPNRGTAVVWKFVPNLKEKDTLSLSCEHVPPAGVDTADETLYGVTLRYVQESLKAQLASGGVSAADAADGTKGARSLKPKDL